MNDGFFSITKSLLKLLLLFFLLESILLKLFKLCFNVSILFCIFFNFSIIFFSSFISFILNTSTSSEINPQEFPIHSAVSILSPVIIQTFIPASKKLLISSLTLLCNLSSKAVTPSKV